MNHRIGWSFLRTCILCSVTAILAACTGPYIKIGTPEYIDYRQKFALTVASVRPALSLPGTAGQERLTPGEIRRIDEFVAGYMAERRGPLTITVPSAAAGDARVLGRAKQIADRARRRGLPAEHVVLRVAADEQRADAPVMVSYEKLVVRVPTCGDWSKESSHDPTNTPSPNFGCSMQRAVGLMIADPADLAAPRQAGLRDAGRSNTVIQLYRAGQPTVTERTTAEEAEEVVAD